MLDTPTLAAKHLDRAATALGLGLLCYLALAMYLGSIGRDGTIAMLTVALFQPAVAWFVYRAASAMGSRVMAIVLALASLLPPASFLVLGHRYRKLQSFTKEHRRSLGEPTR